MVISQAGRPARPRGFTLIELMIVIAIIAILAAILVPNLLHARSEAQVAAGLVNLRHIAKAAEEYAVDHNGAYPTDAQLAVCPYICNGYPESPAPGGGTYTINNAPAAYGVYQITETITGRYDPTAMPGSLNEEAGTPCTANDASLLYDQNSGLHCAP